MQFLLISSFTSLALATAFTPALFQREITCTDGSSVCGSSCYDPTAFLCCTTAGDLCAIGTYCSNDASGNVACCTNGQNCQGSASTGLIEATTVGSSASGTAEPTATATSSSTSSVTCSNGESKCGSGCYDPTAFVCCSEAGALCASGEYCTTNSDSESVCCAVGFNCAGEGSSTTSAKPATTIGASSTALAASTSGNVVVISGTKTSTISATGTAASGTKTSTISATGTAASGSKTSKTATASGTAASASGTSTSSGLGAAMTAVPMYIAGALMGIAAVV